jgi:glucose/arabinose dehydrogenase
LPTLIGYGSIADIVAYVVGERRARLCAPGRESCDRGRQFGSIPEDNPFVGQDKALPEIWSYGHRNQLGAAINPVSKELWAHEMGPKGGDEVNIIEKGKNYGWPIVSEGSHYDDTPIPKHNDNTGFVKPLIAWNPSISPAGLLFYTGNRIANWKDKAPLGGLSS